LDDLKRLRFNATSHGADAAGGFLRPALGFLFRKEPGVVDVVGIFKGYKEDIIWGIEI
jgi:hypothetical protein